MVTLTPKAEKAVTRFVRGSEVPVAGVRLSVKSGGCSGFEYQIKLAETGSEDDIVIDSGSYKLFIDRPSEPYLDGTVIDFYDGLTESGFKFQNPNAKSSCGCGSSFQV